MTSPFKLTQIYQALTAKNQLLKKKLKLGTDDIPIPPKRNDVTAIEAINRFNKANPRVDTTNEGVIQGAFDTATREAQQSGYPAPSYEKFKSRYLKKNMKADGGRIGYKDGLGPSDQPVMGPVYTTNKIEDAAREVVKRLIKLDGVDIPLNEKITMSLGPNLDQTEIKGVIDILGGELNFGGGIKGDEKGFGFNFRKQFQDGGMLVKPSDDGSRPGYAKDDKRGTLKAGKFSSESIGNISDAFLKSYANDDIQILFEKNKTNPNGLISAKDSKAGIFTKITTNENYLQAIVKNTGLDKETILNMIEDRDAFTALEKKVGGQDVRFADRKKFVAQAEKWLLNNGKRYADPVKFEKAFARTFGKNNLITKTIRANIIGARVAGRPTISFSADFVSDIMGSSIGIDKETIKKGKAYAYNSGQLEQMFKTVIYNQNENVKNKILKTFEDIMPEPGSKRTPDLKKIFNNNTLLKKFGINKSITGPIARLLAKEINEDLLNNVKNFQKPFLGTTELIRFLKDRVNPKYKSMFEEAAKATRFAQKNNWPQAKEALNISDAIMFDHKIPKALVEAGYADEIEYIKLNPTSEEFNRTIKRTQFDQPMIKLTNEFERTKSLDAKVKVVEKMNKLKNKFSEKYGGYLDEVSIVPDKTGKPIFKSSAAPVTKQTDFVSSLGKSLVQEGTMTEKQMLQKIQSYSKLSKCKVGAADGGRIGFAYSDECVRDGLREQKIEAQKGNKKAAQELVQVGKVATRAGLLKNLLGPGAILGEAVYEGAVMGNKILGGTPKDIAWAESYLSYLDPRKYTPEGLDPLKMRREDMTTRVDFNDPDYPDGKTVDGPNANILRSGFAAQDDITAFNEAVSEKARGEKAGRLDISNEAAANIQDMRRTGRVSAAQDIISSDAFQDASNMAQEYIANQEAQNRFNLGIFGTPQGELSDDRRRYEANKAMLEKFPMYTPEVIDSMYKEANIEKPENLDINIFNNIMRDQDKMNYFANNFRLEKASGGIASLTKTIPPESGPTPHGLPYVYNNVKKI